MGGRVFYVVIENKKFIQTTTCSEAVALLMASHYVFNLCYNVKVAPSMLFLQVECLQQPVEVMSPSLITLINFKNKYRNK